MQRAGDSPSLMQTSVHITVLRSRPHGRIVLELQDWLGLSVGCDGCHRASAHTRVRGDDFKSRVKSNVSRCHSDARLSA